MSPKADGSRSLREMELEVEAEGREWMRGRLEQKLQAEATRHGGVFPPQPTQGSPSAAADDASAQRLPGIGAKRPGQFWTRTGLRHLDALEEARDNGHWDELWLAT
jgi:hypothetical protein